MRRELKSRSEGCICKFFDASEIQLIAYGKWVMPVFFFKVKVVVVKAFHLTLTYVAQESYMSSRGNKEWWMASILLMVLWVVVFIVLRCWSAQNYCEFRNIEWKLSLCSSACCYCVLILNFSHVSVVTCSYSVSFCHVFVIICSYSVSFLIFFLLFVLFLCFYHVFIIICSYSVSFSHVFVIICSYSINFSNFFVICSYSASFSHVFAIICSYSVSFFLCFCHYLFFFFAFIMFWYYLFSFC